MKLVVYVITWCSIQNDRLRTLMSIFNDPGWRDKDQLKVVLLGHQKAEHKNYTSSEPYREKDKELNRCIKCLNKHINNFEAYSSKST